MLKMAEYEDEEKRGEKSHADKVGGWAQPPSEHD